MKRVVFIFFFISILFILPSKVSAVAIADSCYMDGYGRKVCTFSSNDNDVDFRYTISKIIQNGNNSLSLYGWAFLYNASSYYGSSNEYAIQVLYNGNVIKTYQKEYATTYSFPVLSCYHFQKTSTGIDNNTCLSQTAYGSSGFASWIFNTNKQHPGTLNNVYDYVGFGVTINLNEIRNLISKTANLECPRSTHPSCVKNNCSGVASEKNDSNNNLCSFTREGHYKISLRLVLKAPAGAVNNTNKTFTKDISIYNDYNIISQAVRNYMKNTHGMTISASSYSTSVGVRVESGMLRSGPGLNDPVVKSGGKTVYIPYIKDSSVYYNEFSRTAVASVQSGKIVLDKLLIYGTVGEGQSRKNGPYNTKVLYPGGSSTWGYISESWTHPRNPVTYIDLYIKNNCKCERTPVSYDEGASVPSTCSDNTKTASKNDSMKVDDTISVDTPTALNILLKGDNSTFASNAAYKGMSFNVGKLKAARDNFNYSTNSSCPVYCMQERNFKLYGNNDIYGAITQGKDDSKIYAGRYFRIKKDKMTADITKKCITNPACESYINGIVDSSTINYDTSYKPDNTLKTNMINGSDDTDKKPTISTVKSEIQISKTIRSKYEMRNDQTYYYDYKAGDVALQETDFLIPGKNIYPVPVNTPINKNYNIVVKTKGNKKTNGKFDTDFTYTCSYSPVGKDDGTPQDPDNPSSGNTSYYYRTIGLKNIFPNNRETPYNWNNTKAQEIKKEIESNGENIYSNNPEYKVTITPTQMREIRKYNNNLETNGGYMDYSLTCTTTSDTRKCYSKFLNNIVTKGYAEEFQRGNK